MSGRTELAAAVRVEKGRRSSRGKITKVSVGLRCRMPAVDNEQPCKAG